MSGTAEQLSSIADWSVRNRHVEADLRSDLAQVLVPYALSEVGLAPEFIRQEGTGTAGRFDSMFGSAIIEYKKPTLLANPRERAKAAEQAIGYLEDPRLGARVVIVTDGATWGFLRDQDSPTESSHQIPMSLGLGSAPPIPAVSRFSWRANSVATATAVLDLIASQRASPVTAQTVISALAPVRTEALATIAKLAEIIRNRRPDGRTDTLFRQWILTAGISYGIEGPNEAWPERPDRESLLGATLGPTFASSTFPETIFCLHTYVAIVTKLVAAEVLALTAQKPRYRPTHWPFLTDLELCERLDELENGVLSEQLGAPGLLTADLFEWYASEARSDVSLLGAIRTLLGQLNELSWAQVANAGGLRIDLLRDLYQATVPRGLRKALGEFFTPRWLAEYVYARALQLLSHEPEDDEPIPRTLDPSCGSGTFLVTALRVGLDRLDAVGSGDDLQALRSLIDAVVGIDVNPVSALMARVNLLLTLGDRAALLPEVSFHVFHADSIVLPRVHLGQAPFGTSTTDFIVPTAVQDFHLHNAFMTQTRMAILRDNLEAGLRSKLSTTLFETALGAEMLADGCPADELQGAVTRARELFEQLALLRDAGRDDVWARVLEQFVAPHFLARFKLVVGNPPWVSWKDLPSAWKERSEPIWRSWGLWKTRQSGRGVPLSDISSLLAARSLASYAESGLVAMLLPKSLIIADPGGNAFRRSHLRPEPADRIGSADEANVRFRTVEYDDLSAVNPFSPDASNQTVALFLASGELPRFPTPARIWKRRPGSRLRPESDWPVAATQLEYVDTQIAPVEPDNIQSPWGFVGAEDGMALVSTDRPSRYTFGRGFETRGLDGLFLFSILSASSNDRYVRVRNLAEEGKNTRGETPREGVVEPDLLMPWVKGEDVKRWQVASASRYAFVPYRLDGAVPPRPVTVAQCAKSFPRLFRYLQPWLKRFEGRSLYHKEADAQFPWALSGPIERLAAQGFLVLVRYLATGGRPAAAVCEREYDANLKRLTLPIPNNKSNILYVRSEAEAHYVAAFINSDPAQDALSRFAATTGVTPAALSRLPLPVFSDADPRHAALSELGRSAAIAARQGAGTELVLVEAEINAVCLSLTGPTN